MSEQQKPSGATISAALCAAQRVVENADKSSTNPHHRYQYANADEIVGVARKALASAGLAVSILERTYTLFTDAERAAFIQANTEMPPACWVTTKYRLEVAASGEFRDYIIPQPVLLSKGRPIDKACAAAQTTALAYFLRDLLLIARSNEEVDDRGDSQSDTQSHEDLPAMAPTAPKILPLNEWPEWQEFVEVCTQDQQSRMTAAYPNGCTNEQLVKALGKAKALRAEAQQQETPPAESNGVTAEAQQPPKPAPEHQNPTAAALPPPPKEQPKDSPKESKPKKPSHAATARLPA